MKFGIFGDIHANLEALEVVIDELKKESVDMYICLGDIVGYGANPSECLEISRELAAFTHRGASQHLYLRRVHRPLRLDPR